MTHSSTLTTALADLVPIWRERLVAARNADGGWPYLPGRASRLEPTCTALIALHTDGSPSAIDVLERWPRRDGLFLDPLSNTVNYGSNGVAALLLASAGESVTARELSNALLSALVRERAVELPPSKINRQDNSIRAWSWTRESFSWVEPTAWCLLGVKRLRSAGYESDGLLDRIAGAERLLVDRVCADGGWNHGNSNMLGVELAPYVPTTALALLALQDRRDTAGVAKSLEYLRANCLAERSAMALSLAGICLGIYGEAGKRERALDAALVTEWERAAFLDNMHTTALALCAAAGVEQGFETFRV